MKKPLRAAGLLVLLSVVCPPLSGEPAVIGWRNDGSGRYPAAMPPSEWSGDKNVVWKIALPGAGYGSPIVVGEHLFVVSDPAELLCIRRSDGKVLWRKAANDIKAPPAPRGFGPGGFGPGGFGRGGFGLSRSLAKPLFEALDADKDGKVTKEELAAGVKKLFKEADKDNKGKLSEKSLAAAIDKIAPKQRGARPGGFGPPGRGGFSPGATLAAAIVKRAEPDKEGLVTLDKLTSAAEKLFKEIDKDKKGNLNETAVASAIDLLSPLRRFGGMGGFRPGGGGGRPGRGGGGFGPPSGFSLSAGNSAATPVSDGKRVAALLGNGVVTVYDLEGKRLWGRFIESPRIGFGHAASPLLIGDKLIVHFKDLVALDVATGKERWRTELRPSHASPVATRLGKEDMLLSPAEGAVVRASDGKVLAKGAFESTQSSPVVDGALVCIFGKTVAGLELSRTDKGEVKVKKLWNREGAGEMHHIPSPVLSDGLLYGVTTGGFLEVTDARTGDKVYRQRLNTGQVYSSVALAGGLLYAFDTRGKAVVFKPGRKFERVATNQLEETGTCPVFAGGHLYLRGQKNLYCLGAGELHRK